MWKLSPVGDVKIRKHQQLKDTKNNSFVVLFMKPKHPIIQSHSSLRMITHLCQTSWQPVVSLLYWWLRAFTWRCSVLMYIQSSGWLFPGEARVFFLLLLLLLLFFSAGFQQLQTDSFRPAASYKAHRAALRSVHSRRKPLITHQHSYISTSLGCLAFYSKNAQKRHRPFFFLSVWINS